MTGCEKIKKVIIFGCQKIAVNFVEFVAKKREVEIPLVVSSELPSDDLLGYPSVLSEAKRLGINVVNPPNISSELIDHIAEIEPDIFFTVYYRKILPKRLIEIPELGAVNVHPSWLPSYRGPVPTAWALLNGEEEFGVTLHLIDDGVDTGDILAQEAHKIYHDETGFELNNRAMSIGLQMLKKHFDGILEDSLVSVKQGEGASYYGHLDKKVIIDWRNKAGYLRNLIRVCAKPYNPVESVLLDRSIFINKARLFGADDIPIQKPGRIVKVIDGKPIVSCSDGFLLLEDFEISSPSSELEDPVYLKVGDMFSNGYLKSEK